MSVVDEKPDEAVGLQRERRAGHQGPRLLPAHQLAEGGGARGAAAIHPQNREYLPSALTVLVVDIVSLLVRSHSVGKGGQDPVI